jgi:hypothetical protein
MTDAAKPSDPLTFADMLPDDRSPERVKCDAMREEIAGFMRKESDSWSGWQRLIRRLQGRSETDRAIFDLALRKELVESRDFLPPKAVLGLIFTEMDWWEPEGGTEKRERDLRKMADLFGIEHLKPASRDNETDSKPKNKRRKTKKRGLNLFWVIMGLIFLVILLD